MSLIKPVAMGLAVACLGAPAFAADITIHLAHPNPEDRFASH